MTGSNDARAVYPSLTYADATAAIDWLCRVFGFEKRLVVPGPDGTVMHSELSLGQVVVMVSSPKPEQRRIAPTGLSGMPCAMSISIPDPDAHHARAVAAGAEIVRELCDEDYGSRGYMARDPEGHQWYFGTYQAGAWWDPPHGGAAR